MHEMSVCAALLRQVEAVAAAHGARRVERIRIAVGPLSGVEAALLARAFTVARAGSVAETAELDCRISELRVACTVCGAESPATPNTLLCRACGDWRTRVVRGDELMLEQVELELDDAA